MKKNRNLSLLLSISLMSLFSCEQAQIMPNGTPAAKVGSSTLYQEDISGKVPDAFSPEQRKLAVDQIKDAWIKQELLVQEAERLGISKNVDIQLKVKQAVHEVLAQALREHWLANTDSLVISKSEAQQFYETNKAQFVLQERHVRFRHIQTPDLESSKLAKSALLSGIDFNTVVEKYALDKVTTLNNSSIFFPISVALSAYPELNRYLQVIGINEISPIRLLDGKYHFVQIIDERAAGEHPDLEWILSRITDWLLIEKKRKILTSLERELYLRAEISNEITVYTP